MALVMVSVFCNTSHMTLLSWKVMEIGIPGRSIEEFFYDVVVEKIEEPSNVVSMIKLDKAFIGRSKDSLDQTELGVQLDVAVTNFGSFLHL